MQKLMPFASLVRQIKRSQHEFRVLIIGLDSSGKTTTVRSLLGLETESVQPTLGFQIHAFRSGESNVSLWDVGGQRSIRAFWKSFCDSTDGLFWVLDSADRARMEIARTALLEVLGAERLRGCPVVIFCNKYDVAGALNADYVQQLFSFENRDVAVMAGCGRTGHGVAAAFEWLCTKMDQLSYGGMTRVEFRDFEYIY